MRIRIRLAATLLGATLALTVLGPARASAGLSPAIGDCQQHAALTRHYSIAELQHALNTIPPSISEYSNCSDVIRRALLAQVGRSRGGGSGGSGGSSFLPAWLIVVLAVVVLGGAGAALAARRRP